jgi:hypothetical protein
MSDDKPNPSNNKSQSHKATAKPRPLTAKGLAMEVGVDVRYVRAILRARYRPEGTNERWFPWLWRNKREIDEVRRYVTRVLGRSKKDGGSR